MRCLNWPHGCGEEKAKAGFARGPAVLVKEMAVLLFVYFFPKREKKKYTFVPFLLLISVGQGHGALSPAPCIHPEVSEAAKQKPPGAGTAAPAEQGCAAWPMALNSCVCLPLI